MVRRSTRPKSKPKTNFRLVPSSPRDVLIGCCVAYAAWNGLKPAASVSSSSKPEQAVLSKTADQVSTKPLVASDHPLVVDCSKYLTKEPDYVVPIQGKSGLKMAPFEMSVHDPEKEVISKYLKNDGCFECPILYALLNAMHTTGARTLVDIGGNIGMYTLHAAASNYSAVAFEPFKTNQERICQTVNRNAGFTDKVTLVGVALTEVTKTVSFDTSGFKNAVHRRGVGQLNLGSLIVKDSIASDGAAPQGDEGIDFAQGVMIDNLQDMLPAPGTHVALKVDVEGSECNALTGAMGYLSKISLEYVAAELSYERLQVCQSAGHLQPILDLFSKNGLKCYLRTKVGEWDMVSTADWNDWARPFHPGFFDLAWAREVPNSSI